MRWKSFRLKRGKGGKFESDGDLVAIRVPARMKLQLQKELRAIGVLRRSLFPDLDGLSASINCTNVLYMSSRRGVVNGKVA